MTRRIDKHGYVIPPRRTQPEPTWQANLFAAIICIVASVIAFLMYGGM